MPEDNRGASSGGEVDIDQIRRLKRLTDVQSGQVSRDAADRQVKEVNMHVKKRFKRSTTEKSG